jgi:hypothetical protein
MHSRRCCGVSSLPITKWTFFMRRLILIKITRANFATHHVTQHRNEWRIWIKQTATSNASKGPIQARTWTPGLFSPSLNLPIRPMTPKCVDSIRRTISRYKVLVFQSRDTPIARWWPPSTPANKKATGGRTASNKVAVILWVFMRMNI